MWNLNHTVNTVYGCTIMINHPFMVCCLFDLKIWINAGMPYMDRLCDGGGRIHGLRLLTVHIRGCVAQDEEERARGIGPRPWVRGSNPTMRRNPEHRQTTINYHSNPTIRRSLEHQTATTMNGGSNPTACLYLAVFLYSLFFAGAWDIFCIFFFG